MTSTVLPSVFVADTTVDPRLREFLTTFSFRGFISSPVASYCLSTYSGLIFIKYKKILSVTFYDQRMAGRIAKISPGIQGVKLRPPHWLLWRWLLGSPESREQRKEPQLGLDCHRWDLSSIYLEIKDSKRSVKCTTVVLEKVNWFSSQGNRTD